jgi:hypothetical protein
MRTNRYSSIRQVTLLLELVSGPLDLAWVEPDFSALGYQVANFFGVGFNLGEREILP